MEPVRRRWFYRYLPFGLCALLGLSYFAYIHIFGVNVVYQDEWDFVPYFRDFAEGRMHWSRMFWSIHTDNLMFFPRLLMIGIYSISNYNSKWCMYAGALMQSLSFVLIWLMGRENLPRNRWRAWHAAALAAMIFSWRQQENILWSFQLAWFMVAFFFLLGLYLIDRSLRGDGRLSCAALYAGAVFSGIVASFSSIQGLIVWPAGLAYLALKRRVPWPEAVIWLSAGLACCAAYWRALPMNDPAGAGRGAVGLIASSALKPWYALKFFLAALASMFASHWMDAYHVGIFFAPMLGLFAARLSLSRRREIYALPAALILFALVFDAMLLWGRGHLGLGEATVSRHTAYAPLLMAGLYLFFQYDDSPEPLSPRLLAWARRLMPVLVVAAFVVSDAKGGISGCDWRVKQKRDVRELEHIEVYSPAQLVEALNYKRLDDLKDRLAFLKVRRLNAFHD